MEYRKSNSSNPSNRISRRQVLKTVLAVMVVTSGLNMSCSGHAGESKVNWLDRLSVRGGIIRDSSGRQVVLRGLIATTNTMKISTSGKGMEMSPLELNPSDYQRMKEWGFNVQVIRLEACRLGAAPECTLDPEYLNKIERWTDMAEQHGVYTMFKMTTYDVPSWGTGSAFNPQRWQQFWDNVNNQRDMHLAAWINLFKRFKGRACVIGYDILNEPHQGTDTEPFQEDYLFPYYRRAVKELRKIDSEALLCFQPGITISGYGPLPKLDDPSILYVPHFYPARLEQYEPRMAHLVKQAQDAGYAMMIPEYGLPERNLPNLLPAWTPEFGRAKAALFDRYGLGCTRAWYDHTPFWGVLNADWSEQKEKFDILSRPYPQRIAGQVKGWSFDFKSRVFRVEIEPTKEMKAPSEIYVPARRHYPNGFVLELNGVKLNSTPGEKNGLREANAAASTGASFDFTTEVLRVKPRKERLMVTIRPQ